MKKSIKVILAFAAVFMVLVCMSGAVMAEDETPTPTSTQIPVTGTATTGGNTEVKYTVQDGYILTIPDAVDFSTHGLTPAAQDYSVTGVKIAAGKTLTVTVETTHDVLTTAGDSDAYFQLGNAETNGDATSHIPYTIKIGDTGSLTAATALAHLTLTVDPATVGGESSDVEADDANGGVQLVKKMQFSTTETNIKKATRSGDHTDKLTFSVTIEAPATP